MFRMLMSYFDLTFFCVDGALLMVLILHYEKCLAKK